MNKPAAQIKNASFISFASVAKPQRLSFSGTSFVNVRAALEEIYGLFPIRLSQKHDISIISGMAAASGEGRVPYEQICNALDQFGELELTLEA